MRERHLRTRGNSTRSESVILRCSGFEAQANRRCAGCIDAIKPHLPTLFPYVLGALNHPEVRPGNFILDMNVLSILLTKPLVRSNTCWTLGKYASWCSQSISQEHTDLIFVPTLHGVSTIVCP